MSYLCWKLCFGSKKHRWKHVCGKTYHIRKVGVGGSGRAPKKKKRVLVSFPHSATPLVFMHPMWVFYIYSITYTCVSTNAQSSTIYRRHPFAFAFMTPFPTDLLFYSCFSINGRIYWSDNSACPPVHSPPNLLTHLHSDARSLIRIKGQRKRWKRR